MLTIGFRNRHETVFVDIWKVSSRIYSQRALVFVSQDPVNVRYDDALLPRRDLLYASCRSRGAEPLPGVLPTRDSAMSDKVVQGVWSAGIVCKQ